MSTSTKQILLAHLAALQAQKDAVVEKTAKEREARDKLHAQKDAVQAQIDKLSAKINADNPELVRVSNEISTVAKAIGGKSMSNSIEPQDEAAQ
jgi:uncharacterized coiled-coil DUF342 family protein